MWISSIVVGFVVLNQRVLWVSLNTTISCTLWQSGWIISQIKFQALIYLTFFFFSVSDKLNVYSCVWTTDLAAVLFVFTLHNNLMNQTRTTTVYGTQFETGKKTTNQTEIQSFDFSITETKQFNIYDSYWNCQTQAKKMNLILLKESFLWSGNSIEYFATKLQFHKAQFVFLKHTEYVLKQQWYFWYFVQRDECSKTECFRSKSPNFIVQFSCELNIQWELWFSLFRIRWLSFSVPTLSSLECLLSLG